MFVIRLPNGNLMVPESALAERGQLMGDAYVEIGPGDADYARLAAQAMTEEELEQRRRSWREGDAALAAGVREVPGQPGRAATAGVSTPIKTCPDRRFLRPNSRRQCTCPGRRIGHGAGGVPGRAGVSAEQSAYLRLAEPAVPPGRPDAADAAGCRPPGHRLRVYSEEGCHLPGSEKALIVPVHVSPPVSGFGPVLSVAKTSVFSLDSGKSLVPVGRPSGCRASAAGWPWKRGRRACPWNRDRRACAWGRGRRACPGPAVVGWAGAAARVGRGDPGRRGAPGRRDRGHPAGAVSRVAPRLLIKPESLAADRRLQAARRVHGDQRAARGRAQRGVVTHSSGNHAQAVAYAAALLASPRSWSSRTTRPGQSRRRPGARAPRS